MTMPMATSVPTATSQAMGAPAQPNYASDISSALMSWLGYNAYEDPSKGAMGYLEQIPGVITPYFQPYVNAGTTALPMLMEQITKLVNDPAAIMQMLGSGFQESPGYDYQVQQATQAANQAAAAGGMVGSPMEQQQLASSIMGMANQDYYNYLNHIMKLYGGGMKGLGGLTKLGYKAGSTLATDLANVLESQADLSYKAARGQNLAKAGLFGGASNAATDLMSGLFSVGSDVMSLF